jgi:hypothetical protein
LDHATDKGVQQLLNYNLAKRLDWEEPTQEVVYDFEQSSKMSFGWP